MCRSCLPQQPELRRLGGQSRPPLQYVNKKYTTQKVYIIFTNLIIYDKIIDSYFNVDENNYNL